MTIAPRAQKKKLAILALVLAAISLAVSAVFIARHGLNVETIIQSVAMCGAGVATYQMQSLRDAKRDNFRGHGLRTAYLHLFATNLAALSYAWFMYIGYVRDGVVGPFGSAGKDYMLATTLVGGTLALFRSSGTSSAVYALVRQIEDLQAQVRGSADLASMALEAQRASDVRELAELAGRMMDSAIDSHEASDDVDALTLWLRDDSAGRWRIFAGKGVSEKTMREFWQPVISTETRGAGVVSNMAATRTPHLAVSDGIASHDWFARDASSSRMPGSFAAVLIYDQRREPVGALCLTSQRPGAVPSEKDAEAFPPFRKVLYLWAAVFTLLVERHFELEKEADR